jgi:hypothetical protein
MRHKWMKYAMAADCLFNSFNNTWLYFYKLLQSQHIFTSLQPKYPFSTLGHIKQFSNIWKTNASFWKINGLTKLNFEIEFRVRLNIFFNPNHIIPITLKLIILWLMSGESCINTYCVDDNCEKKMELCCHTFFSHPIFRLVCEFGGQMLLLVGLALPRPPFLWSESGSIWSLWILGIGMEGAERGTKWIEKGIPSLSLMNSLLMTQV